VLELGRGGIPQIVMNQLYKPRRCRRRSASSCWRLVDRRPQVVDLKAMLTAFVGFRREIVTRRTKYDLTRAEERAHILPACARRSSSSTWSSA